MECLEASFSVPSLIQGKILSRVTQEIDEYFIREPIGIIAHIAPFNFPGMIPFEYLPFGGTKNLFFGVLHGQLPDIIIFVLTRK